MKKWIKEDAVTYLESLIDAIPQIKQGGRKSSEHIRWLSNSLRFLEEVFGEKSLYYVNIKYLP